MSVELNHTIVWCDDQKKSATFFADVLGLSTPKPFGHFLVIETANGVSLDFAETDSPISSQHYAFLISEEEFDQVYQRIKTRDLPYWADPRRQRKNQINQNGGGRGMYFEDPAGHFLEVITRPYGGGG